VGGGEGLDVDFEEGPPPREKEREFMVLRDVLRSQEWLRLGRSFVNREVDVGVKPALASGDTLFLQLASTIAVSHQQGTRHGTYSRRARSPKSFASSEHALPSVNYFIPW
jgi:hypothetical protein